MDQSDRLHLEPNAYRRFRDWLSDTQRSLGRLNMGPTSGMRTDLMAADKPVIFIHNPRTGGRSLEKLLGVKRLSHAFPTDRLTEAQWLDHFVVTSIRNPFERFLSTYYGHILDKRPNWLVKQYGWEIKNISPFQLLDVIRDYPRFTGSQLQWTDFPSSTKPRADLLLRLEEVGDWETKIRAAGIHIGDRHLTHVGKSKNQPDKHLDRLNMNAAEFDRLRSSVEGFFAHDYVQLGYSMGA